MLPNPTNDNKAVDKPAYVSKPPCHEGTIQVFTDPATGQKWFAGGSSRKFAPPSDAVLVALADTVLDIKIISNIPLVPEQDPTVYIKWWDGDEAPLKKQNDWVGLLRALRATKLPVAVACMGGHGRTGTFLAIMAWLMGLPQEANKKPVQYIRDIYCIECVESRKQFEQIRDMTGEDETKLYTPTVTYYQSGFQNWNSGGGWQGNTWTPPVKKAYAHDCVPDDENERLGWFFGQMPDTTVSYKRYDGYPSSTGKWMTDSVGWYWKWDGVKEPTYIPLPGTIDEGDELSEDDGSNAGDGKGTDAYLNGYQNTGSDW